MDLKLTHTEELSLVKALQEYFLEHADARIESKEPNSTTRPLADRPSGTDQ